MTIKGNTITYNEAYNVLSFFVKLDEQLIRRLLIVGAKGLHVLLYRYLFNHVHCCSVHSSYKMETKFSGKWMEPEKIILSVPDPDPERQP